MTKPTGIPKRWRPRFSLRTLILFMTLVCLYFGAWEATKRYAAKGQQSIDPNDLDIPYQNVILAVYSPMPFVVCRDYPEKHPGGVFFPTLASVTRGQRRYYLWLIGWEAKLPYESSWQFVEPQIPFDSAQGILGPHVIDPTDQSRGQQQTIRTLPARKTP